ncbi:RNA-guided endonuclease InsQ/TnpB family protein [Streptomyces azureus]|uniref:RNA-guided endonuclease InsQ/TnpB family protein n=1 Tax=Streptomyces azureus TaxID=146537 RepID=UPI000750C00B|nr:zinc ribbon domain-containing protein [Streptomyces azureus]
MKLVVQVRLLPTPVQAAALEATLRGCNEAATWVSRVAFEHGEFRNFALRRLTYEQVKSRWNLGAQAARHTIKKTCDAYATLKANLRAGRLGRPGSARYRRATQKPVAFRSFGAQPYDDRMLSWQIAGRTVSVWTTGGRMKNVAFTASVEQLATLALYRRGESDLVHRDGMWFLNATCEIPEAEPNTEPVDFLGIDLGIVNIATTSDSSWSFAQLGQFITYKARKAGVPVVHVDPAYTSRTCAECGHIDAANRVSQAWFACRSCGFVDHADRNSSRNIRARAWELWRRGAQSTAPAPPPKSVGGAGRRRSITASGARCAPVALATGS